MTTTTIIIIIIIIIITIILSLTRQFNKLVCRGFYQDTTHPLPPSSFNHKQFKPSITHILEKTFVFGIVNAVGYVNLQRISEVQWTIHHSLSICTQSLPPVFWLMEPNHGHDAFCMYVGVIIFYKSSSIRNRAWRVCEIDGQFIELYQSKIIRSGSKILTRKPYEKCYLS
jgi:hypothetical protein